jgi:ribosomal protein S12 methylthiotransferase accessory factor YcaO
MVEGANDGGDSGRRGKGSMRGNVLASSLMERLERFEIERNGGTAREARRRVAKLVGVGPATLDNIRRGRIKEARFSLVSKLLAAVINETQRQIRALEHDLQVARQVGVPAGDDAIVEVETHIARARACLAEIVGGAP